MSNYSEGTQVPFGDGSHVPPEEGADGNFESDNTMQTAMKNIFLACDPNNSNSARVSDLINFMIPHMHEHTSQLTILKIALDPNDTDPYVNSETFYKMMKEWISQFMEEPVAAVDNNSSLAKDIGIVKEKDSSLSKSSVGQRFLKGCAESDSMSLNLSTSSMYSGTGNSGIDVTVLQEKINELEHQNRKLTEELEHSRAHLTISEEHNESLQAEVQKLARRLIAEQQTNSQLEKDRQNTEDVMEVSSAAQRQLGKLEKDLASSEKQVSKLKQQICNLETENQKFEDKIDQLVKRDTESKHLIQKLQNELHIKDQEILSLEDSYTQATVRLTEQKQLVSHYTSVNKSLKEEKLKMEKNYYDAMKTRFQSTRPQVSRTYSESSISSKSGTSINLIPKKEFQSELQETSSVNNNNQPIYKERQFHSPLAKLYQNKGFIYNSPRFLDMIANPVSPQLDKSIVSSVSCKKSVDSDDSPHFLCEKNEENSVFTYTSSTPQRPKTLLDQTPPTAVRNLPHLLPNKLLSNRLKKYKSPIKKDLQLFRQYRYVGSSSSDEEENINCDATEHANVLQIKQEYDSNLNIISTPESLRSAEDEKKEGSLPTMYVVDNSFGKPRSKSASSGSPNNLKNITDSSYEDDPLLWKFGQQTSPHESLESEISQAKFVDKQIAELKSTIQRLMEENDRLKSQIENNEEKVKNYSPERREHSYEMECKALKIKVQDLESDSNHKYIRIIDLMEEKERLQKELKRINGKDTDEIKSLKQNISELHHEKKNILKELQQQKWEKQNCDSIIKHLQSVKHDCDILQNLLQHSKQNGEELSKELDKISVEKCGLKVKIDKLKSSMREMNDKNNELNTTLQSVSDEYIKLKKTIKLKTVDESDIPHDKINRLENGGLICEQNGHLLETYKEHEKAFHLQEEEIKILNNTITKHESTIVSLKKDISDLITVNSKLSQNTTEKENQIVALKQIIAHQNESLKEMTSNKETSTTKIYEQKCENEKLYESNKELTKNNNEKAKQLELLQKEKEYLCVRLQNLEEENKSILAEFKTVTGDYKNIKDSDNKLMKDYKLLVTEKEVLSGRYEQLTNDYKKIKELKEDIEQQLQEMKNEALDLSSCKKHSSTREGTKHSSPKRKSKEETHDRNRYTKVLSKIRQKIEGLESTNIQLQSENIKLQEEFKEIKNTYDTLAKEKELWVTEKNEWLQLKDELSQKLTKAMSESKLLEEQLSNINRASLESLHESKSSCSNCPILKNEIENLNTRVNELQKQVGKKIPSQKYDRMQTTIEKLKNKNFGLEEELKNVKKTTTSLESENSKLKKDTDENFTKYIQEISSLQIENTRIRNELKENCNLYKKEKVDLLTKLSNLEEELKKLQKHMKELEQERTITLQECNSLKEKLEASVKEKENRVKSINKETNQLKLEIQEQVKQKTKLEKKLATAENLLKCKLNVDKINKENSQLKQGIEEANKQITEFEKKIEKVEQDLKDKQDLEQKLKDYQESVAQENLNIKEQIEDLEKKLEKAQNDLQESESKNLSIKKELVDKQITHDTIVSSECNGIEKFVEENCNLQKQLKSYENQLADITIKLTDTNNCLHTLSEHVVHVNQKLNEERLKLHYSTLTAVNNWRATLVNEADTKPVVEVFHEEEPVAPNQIFMGPLDEEMCKFKHQIHVSSLVLDTLGKLKIHDLEITSASDTEKKSPSSLQKSVKKLIPKTKTVSPRSISPSQKGKPKNTDTGLPRSRTVPSLSTGSREVSPKSDAKLSRSVRPNSPIKNIKVRSNDTSAIRSKWGSSLPNQSSEVSTVNKMKNYVGSDGSGHCPVDTNVACYKSQVDNTEDTTLSEDEEVDVGLGTNTNTPSLSSNTLESLGLLYDGDSPNWSKKEIEEKFHILVTCFMMDVVTIKERYKKQQILQSKIENRFTMESEKAVTVLKVIKQLDKDQQVKVLITTCLSHIKHMVGMFSQTAMSATQSGALQHEQQSLKIINVMINHAANLRHRVENTSPRLKSIGSSISSPKHRKSPEVLGHNSTGTVQLKVSSIFELNNDKCSKSSTSNLNDVEERNETVHDPTLVSSGAKRKKDSRANVRPGLIQNILLFYLLLFLTVITAIVFIGNSTSNGKPGSGYPWHWVSWDDIFAPFVKRSYPDGPPPT